jgi:hypothetical protein
LDRGNEADRLKAANEILEASSGPDAYNDISVILLDRLGNADAALGLIDGVASTSTSRARSGLAFISDGTRARPGFEKLARRLGLVSYWRETRPPDFCEQEDAPALCDGL